MTQKKRVPHEIGNLLVVITLSIHLSAQMNGHDNSDSKHHITVFRLCTEIHQIKRKMPIVYGVILLCHLLFTLSREINQIQFVMYWHREYNSTRFLFFLTKMHSVTWIEISAHHLQSLILDWNLYSLDINF